MDILFNKKMTLSYNLQFFADGPGGEKTEEPTTKKLDDARKEGQVAKSKEVASSVTLFFLFILLKVWIGVLSEQLLELFNMIYSKFPELTKLYGGKIESKDFAYLVQNSLLRVLIIILPFLLMGFVIAFVADLAQVKWKPTTKPLQPKFSKLNPVSGVKKLFNVQALVELIKSILKLGIMAFIIYSELSKQWKNLFLLYDMTLIQAIELAGNILINIGLKISAIFLIIAAADFMFQKWKFKRDMRMTKQEVKEEYKMSEGDPQIKGKIRSKMQEASRRRMMQDLPKADVVITNPTHYAVAVVYDKDIADAPIVVAKGADYLAAKIKEEAKKNNIYIMENKPLARSLYANVEIGQQVPSELYVAVAEVLAAVYKAEGRI